MSKSPKKTPIPKEKKVSKPLTAARTTHTNTKSALILKLLVRASGATMKELAAATNWQDHSVRGYLSGTLKKKMGLLVTSVVTNGTRQYKVNRQGPGQ